MQETDLIQLVRQIQTTQCERQTIDVKRAHDGCPTRLYDTLSSFSNQDGGGVIVFGLDENARFEVTGVYDAQDLQKRVVEQCKQMIPVVRPLFTVCAIGEKSVVSAEIPGVDVADRPVYYAGKGIAKGSFIRAGEADEMMSAYEIYSYEAYRKSIRDDLRVVDGAKDSWMDEAAIDACLDSIRKERKNLAVSTTRQDLLELMGLTVQGAWTLTAVMVFSKYPQAYFPQLCISAVVVPGTRMGETGERGERFIANNRITGTIPEMLDDAVDFVRRNARTKTIITDDGKRVDEAEFPMKAVREAIINALVHRDYSIHSQNIPIRIEMYSDRMEIKNSGGLYGRISIDSLGHVHPETRNATLANILEAMRVTENRYSGIPTIRYEFRRARLPEPAFKVVRGDFTVIFRNDIAPSLKALSKTELRKLVLAYCVAPRTREELTAYTGYSRNHTIQYVIMPLVEEGLLKLTMPDKPKSKNQRYQTVQSVL